MNKAEFVQRVAQLSGLSARDSRKAVEAIFGTEGEIGVIAESLGNDQKINLPGFGIFETRTRPGRESRNPRSGELMKIPSSNVPAFRAGNHLKSIVRG